MAKKFRSKKILPIVKTIDRPVRIWVDGYEANVEQRVGSGQVAVELLKHLYQIDQINQYTILLPSAKLADLPEERTNWQYQILKPHRLWTRIALPLKLLSAKQKPDVFFSPGHYAPLWSRIPRVITIFDLAYWNFPEMFKPRDLWQLKHWSKQSIKKAKQIITISQSTKADLLKHYKVLSKNITVAYPGYDQNIFKEQLSSEHRQQILDKYQIKGDYFIYTGTLQPRKNLIRLIDAFSKLIHEPGQNFDMQLVIVGKTKGAGRQGWMYQEILDRPKQLGIEDRVIFTGFAPTEELPYLMSGALAYVLPSLYEGFGIPVVEAMACGTPVIVSKVSSLPEVVGSAGIQVDPTSIDQIEHALRLMATDQKLRLKLSKLGLEQVKQFNWQKMARQVLKVLQEVAVEHK